MITKCFVVITLISLIYALPSGNIGEITNAVIDGAGRSISLSISLCGMSCLWCGIMQVLTDSGVLDAVAKLLSPILRLIFPDAWKNESAKREITAAVSANLLGIGNAATPYALAAMRTLDSLNPSTERTSRDMAAFVMLGCASLNIAPTTLIALRRAAGAAEPYSIIPPIWICSLACAALGVLLVKLFGRAKAEKSGTDNA